MKYRDAGVDIQAAREIKAEIKRVARRTLNEKVLWSIGAFGAGYELNDGPILVSSTDSVGTKILIARMINEHHSIGEDIVNHCVNDILCQGAEPLFCDGTCGRSRECLQESGDSSRRRRDCGIA